jgi:hypothetical protein
VVAVIVAGALGGALYLGRGNNSENNPTGPLPPIVETKPATGHLTLGTETPIATQTIGVNGGTISAQRLQVQVLDGTLAADTQFDVRQSPITASTFDGFVTPITPLYLIDDGGATFDKPVTVVLPATIPAGATAMAFSYDDASGMLTPLMPIAQDATTLTVAATHFSPIFGGLLNPTDESVPVDSGFRPGTDDWQFTNYPAYVAPSGICEGMNLSAIWYYVTRPLGTNAPPLHGPSDNNGVPPRTPALWQDDSNAYRFAASIQAGPIGSWPMYSYLSDFGGLGDEKSNYEAVRAAIKATGQPQLMTIDTEARNAAHSLIVVEVEANRLLVSDPNYPGPANNPRWIPYDPATGKLGPYSSGKNSADIAAHGAKTYTRFAYIPRETSATDAVIAARWAEFQSKTAGDDVFPKYELEALAGQDAQGEDIWVSLVDGYQATAKQLTIRILDPQDADQVQMTVYRSTSSTLAAPADNQVTIDLSDGANPLGILEEGSKPSWTKWTYVTFVRLNVTYGQGVQVSVSPTTITDPSAFHTLKIDLSNIPPSVTSFRTVVDWGDGRSPQVLADRHPESDGTAHVVMTSIYPPPNGGKDVTGVTVSFQDAAGNPLISCPEPTNAPPSGGCRKWPTVQIPVIQPSAAPPLVSASIEIWMGHCSFCLDFRPGKPIRLVAGEPGVYTGNPADLAAMGLASLDLQMGSNGRTITSLRVAYADDPDNWFVLTNIPITATITDPTDQKAMSQFSLGSWAGIMSHLQWQANITIANGSHQVVTQAGWIEDPSSAGQEYLNIYLKQP